MTSIWDRSKTAASNTSTPPAGFPADQVPSLVAPQFRAEMAYETEFVHSIVAGGTADALTVTYTNVPASLTDGMEIHVRAAAANTTTTPTLNVNSLGAKTITKLGGTALIAGDIAGDLHELDLRYNLANTRWELMNPANPLAGLSTKTTPTTSDSVVIMDVADSSNAKTTTIAHLLAAGTASTRTVKTSSSGTYTTPTGATLLKVRMVGGGGGGGGSASDSSATNGGAGGNTSFGTPIANGGKGGNASNNGGIGLAGASSGNGTGTASVRIEGSKGEAGANAQTTGTSFGGNGCPSPFGSPGLSQFTDAGASATGPGSGGSGAGSAGNAAVGTGAGGSAAEYVELIISAPDATYDYVVGAAGTAGTAGTNGKNGGAGAAGLIIIDEFYD